MAAKKKKNKEKKQQQQKQNKQKNKGPKDGVKHFGAKTYTDKQGKKQVAF